MTELEDTFWWYRRCEAVDLVCNRWHIVLKFAEFHPKHRLQPWGYKEEACTQRDGTDDGPSPQAFAAFRVEALERSRVAAAHGLLQYVDWSRGQERRFRRAIAESKHDLSKADAGSPSRSYFPAAERFRSRRAESLLINVV